ncbi:MAG: hypothetical protein WAM42_02810 [Candidatus Nitrosopolaris sp.]
MRTKLKNKIHSIMFMNGTSISYGGTHTFTKGYIEKLKELNDYRINGCLRNGKLIVLLPYMIDILAS